MTIADEILDFTFSGDPADPIKRHLTGLYSFDHAFVNAEDEIGMPIGIGCEVFGAKSIGKSSFVYSLAGMIGKQLELDINLGDLEGFDPKYLSIILKYMRFDKNIHLIHQGTDEEILTSLMEKLLDDEDSIGILDSIAAISPVSEKKSELGASNMGRRGLLMAQFSRGLLPTVHPRKLGSRNIFFLTNHWNPQPGSMSYVSPGGYYKDYLCAVQIHLKRTTRYDDGSWLLTGTLRKNRYGFDKRQFRVFMKGGKGIHKGLTAVVDAVDFGFATKDKVIRIKDKSFGYFKHMIFDEWENDEFFQSFYDVLKDNTVLNNSENENEN